MEFYGLHGSIGASSVSERVTIRRLLTQARDVYDSKVDRLEDKVRNYRWNGIQGCTEWMREVLTILRRGQIPRGHANFTWLAIIKYGLSFSIFTLTIPVCGLFLGFVTGVILFYAIESQMTFLFPCALDGITRPFRESRALAVQAGGTLHVMRVVMGLAIVMMGGGWFGYGFIRSWCLGCIAILIWYEDLRKNKSVHPARSN